MTIATFDAVSPERQKFGALLLAGLRAHLLPLGLTALAWFAVHGFILTLDEPRNVDFASFAIAFVMMTLPTLLLAVTVIRFFHIALHVRPKHPLPALAADLRAFFTNPARLASGLPLVVGLSFFMEAFNQLKYNIPVIQPFAWDQTFDTLDRWLHFGSLPWEWLQPVLGFPFVTFLLNVNYNLWFMVMWCLWVFLAFQPAPSVLRMRFFLTFIGSWAIGGGIAAVALSSAGPAYYSSIGLSPDPYAPLMAYLQSADATWKLWALDTQRLLWDAHTGQQNVIAGISAMPSMHNGSALLFALAGWHLHRIAGIALSVFAALIFLGSIHLGWHYAVDAYIGWVITLAVWWACGPVARWNQQQSWTRSFVSMVEAQPAR
ncbi:phosphatase PAP2 family protein [Tepidamorphus sp. 3E244]|uniref:phosphatase PAP2 family protein n=1 Tax=Tepidamorphus sp. 3E244 TaxID=3385498 RepID=UPI0038FCBA58